MRRQQQRSLGQKPASRTREQPLDGGQIASAVRPLRVLLVEDDFLIRCTTAAMLENLGHTVAEAANSTQALKLLDDRRFNVLPATSWPLKP